MLQALSFLTILGRGAAPSPRALPYFPIVGGLIGLAVGYAWYGGQQVLPPLVAAGIALLVDVVITGMLHLDGLADSGDGLVAPLDSERRLAAMRDVSVGAFGAITLIIVLLLRFSVFASIAARPLTVAALWCLSRAAMALVTVTVRYARTSGLASAFQPHGRAGGRASAGGDGDSASSRGASSGHDRGRGLPGDGGGQSARRLGAAAAAIGVAVAVPLVVLELGALGLVSIAAAAAMAALMTAFTRARVGGFTGDTLGATGVLAETAGLIALAAMV